MLLDAGSVGARTAPRVVRWRDRETLLYALGVGAGPDDLALTTENSHGVEQQVLPTYAVIVCSGLTAIGHIGPVDRGTLLHGAQEVRVHRPLPPAGSLSVVAEVTGLEDKGKGRNAVVHLTGRGTDPDSGDLVAETVTTLVLRGQGGFGGASTSRPGPAAMPEREPDATVRYRTRDDQALLYRLSGDRNPLHSDPWFAREKAGFPRPLLHGLCTYGIAGRGIVEALCPGRAGRLTALSARFTSPVFPGDVLTTSVWRGDPGVAVYRTEAAGPDGGDRRIVLDGGRVEYRAEL